MISRSVKEHKERAEAQGTGGVRLGLFSFSDCSLSHVAAANMHHCPHAQAYHTIRATGSGVAPSVSRTLGSRLEDSTSLCFDSPAASCPYEAASSLCLACQTSEPSISSCLASGMASRDRRCPHQCHPPLPHVPLLAACHQFPHPATLLPRAV